MTVGQEGGRGGVLKECTEPIWCLLRHQTHVLTPHPSPSGSYQWESQISRVSYCCLKQRRNFCSFYWPIKHSSKTMADHCAKMDQWAGPDSREMACAAGSGSAPSVVSDRKHAHNKNSAFQSHQNKEPPNLRKIVTKIYFSMHVS